MDLCCGFINCGFICAHHVVVDSRGCRLAWLARVGDALVVDLRGVRGLRWCLVIMISVTWRVFTLCAGSVTRLFMRIRTFENFSTISC